MKSLWASGRNPNFWRPSPNPTPRHPAGTDRHEALEALKRRGVRYRAGVEQERIPARTAVARDEDRNGQGNAGQTQHHKVSDARARDEDDRHPDGDDQACGRHVRLQRHRHQDEGPADEERSEPAPHVPHQRLLAHGQRGRPDDDGQFGRIRRLEGDAQVEPAACALDRRCNGFREGQNDDDQEEHRCQEDVVRVTSPHPRGDAGTEHHDHQADGGADPLPGHVVVVREIPPLRHHGTRAVEGEEAEEKQHDRQGSDGGRLPAVSEPRLGKRPPRLGRDVPGPRALAAHAPPGQAAWPAPQAHHPAATARARNAAPRAS